MTRKNRSVDLTQVIEWDNEKATRVQDYVATVGLRFSAGNKSAWLERIPTPLRVVIALQRIRCSFRRVQ
jgi:hypothetical protein